MLPPIICWGEVLWDRFPDGDRLGGAVANVAWHLAMLGAPVALVTRVGDDEDGREAIRRLAARGVDTSLVQVDATRATGEVRVEVARGEPRYTLVPDRAWERIEATSEALAAIERAPAFVYGTLAQRAGLDAWRAAVTAARGLKVCDPNLRPGKEDRAAVGAALEVADVVKLGEREVDACARAVMQADLLGWLLARRDPPAALVALTRGARGSTLHTAEHRVEVPAIPAARGGDNVGCGDAYLAVLVHGLVARWPHGEIGEVASRWASIVAGARGATPDLDADTIARLTSRDP